MNVSRIKVRRSISYLSDMSAIAVSWFFAYLIRFHAGLPVPFGVPDPIPYIRLTPVILFLWSAVFIFGGFYNGARIRLKSRGLGQLVKLSLLSMTAFLAVSSFYHEYRYSRMMLISFALIHPFLIYWLRRLLYGNFFSNETDRAVVGVICHPERLQEITRLARHYFESAPKLQVFFYPQNTLELDFADVSGCTFTNLKVIDKNFFVSHQFEFLWVALRVEDFAKQELIMSCCLDQVTNIVLLPDTRGYSRFGFQFEHVSGQPLMQLNHSPLEGYLAPLKRIMDICGALVGLVVFSPVLFFIALGVRLSSPGPIFFRQLRMGIDGKTFEMLKFRSMPEGIEKNTGAVWARQGDDRSTTFGKVIRRFSLDELPQLFNVLRGDMSLVGPRPERPVFVEKFRNEIPGYMLRHKVRAGMTGLAQINGWRGNTSLHKRIDCDLHYIRCWSPWLDVKILLKTIIKGFYHPNAH